MLYKHVPFFISKYAHELLEYVLDLDDENPDLWYLMGINANSRTPCDEETAEDAFNTAKSMLESYLEQDPELEVSVVLSIFLGYFSIIKIIGLSLECKMLIG